MLCYCMLCYCMLCYCMLCYCMLCYCMLCYCLLLLFCFHYICLSFQSLNFLHYNSLCCTILLFIVLPWAILHGLALCFIACCYMLLHFRYISSIALLYFCVSLSSTYMHSNCMSLHVIANTFRVLCCFLLSSVILKISLFISYRMFFHVIKYYTTYNFWHLLILCFSVILLIK